MDFKYGAINLRGFVEFIRLCWTKFRFEITETNAGNNSSTIKPENVIGNVVHLITRFSVHAAASWKWKSTIIDRRIYAYPDDAAGLMHAQKTY